MIQKYEEQFERIATIIKTCSTNSIPSITPEVSLKSLGIDALDLIEIVMEIEDQFRCMIDDLRLEECETVGQLAHYVYTISKK